MPNLLKAEEYSIGADAFAPMFEILPPAEPEPEPDTLPEPEETVPAPPAPPERDFVKEAREEAARILAAAEAEAGKIRLRAKEEGFARGREEGFAAGLREGTEKGLEEGRKIALAEARRLRREAETRLADLARVQEERFESFREEARQTILDIARKVLLEEAAAAPERMEPLILDVLREFKKEHPVVLTVSEELERCLDESPTFRNAVAELGLKLEVRASETFGPGDCLAETETYAVDAGIDTQLDNIRRAYARRKAV